MRDPEGVKARTSAYQKRNQDRSRPRSWRKLGIDLLLEEYYEMAARQDNKCAVCKNPPGRRALHVDHCHKTGKVRGLLCGGCNASAGQAGDDPIRLRAIAAYLEQHQ